MSDFNRREFGMALAALAALGGIASEPAEAQSNPGGPATGPTGKLSNSCVFEYADLPVKQNPNGGTGRQVMSGTLATGEFIEVHETSLPAGQMPHPAHKHSHSELLLIREGTLQYDNDGKLQHVGPGGVVFSASNIMHGLKNVGTTTASYFVVAVGVQSHES